MGAPAAQRLCASLGFHRGGEPVHIIRRSKTLLTTMSPPCHISAEDPGAHAVGDKAENPSTISHSQNVHAYTIKPRLLDSESEPPEAHNVMFPLHMSAPPSRGELFERFGVWAVGFGFRVHGNVMCQAIQVAGCSVQLVAHTRKSKT